MTQSESTIFQAIQHAKNSDPSEMQNSLDSAISDKVADAINLRKIAIAGKLFNNVSEEEEDVNEGGLGALVGGALGASAGGIPGALGGAAAGHMAQNAVGMAARAILKKRLAAKKRKQGKLNNEYEVEEGAPSTRTSEG